MDTAIVDRSARAEWRATAACVDHPQPYLWFSSVEDDRRAARRICAGCPSYQECVLYFMTEFLRGETAGGTWGGMYFSGDSDRCNQCKAVFPTELSANHRGLCRTCAERKCSRCDKYSPMPPYKGTGRRHSVCLRCRSKLTRLPAWRPEDDAAAVAASVRRREVA